MNLTTNKLKEIIQNNFGVDVDSKVKNNEVVECRIIYAKILRDRGWTMNRIGDTINKNHSTIVHYIKKYKDTIHYNKKHGLEHKYNIIKKIFESHMQNRLKSLYENEEYIY